MKRVTVESLNQLEPLRVQRKKISRTDLALSQVRNDKHFNGDESDDNAFDRLYWLAHSWQ